MAKVRVVGLCLGQELEFDEKEELIVQHWCEAGNVTLLLASTDIQLE